jgi:tetratricopeptide (TPR) repeat protein
MTPVAQRASEGARRSARSASIASCAAALLLCACAGAPQEPLNARLARAADYNRRGETALERGEYRRALALYEAALRIDVSIEHAEGVAINSLNLARVHQLLGEDALAQQRLDALLGGGLAPIPVIYVAAARLRKAVLYQSAGDASAASAWADRAAELCRDSGCSLYGSLLNLRSRVALAGGDDPGASALAAQALSVNRGRGAREEIANSLRLQAQAQLRRKAYAAALAPLEEALALDQALGLPDRIALDLRFLADAHAGAGDAEQARELRARAANVARQALGRE